MKNPFKKLLQNICLSAEHGAKGASFRHPSRRKGDSQGRIAKVLAGEKDSEKIKRVANLVVAENLSVRETENLLKKKIQAPTAKSQTNAMLSEKFDQLRQRLEQNTGYHFGIKATKNGAGQFSIKFSNEAEFNDIFEYLLAKR